MCGLTGFFRPNDSVPPSSDEQRALERMNDAIAHRGPDEDGTWVGPGIGLAARRLSIIDVASSQQPRISPSGNTVCVFNGEIYNFQALREELASRVGVAETEVDAVLSFGGFCRSIAVT